MISIDQLLAIKSLVGSEAPRWMPDGERIVFASGLGGGVDLLTDAVELEDLIVSHLGSDLMIEGFVKRRESRDVYRTCRGIG